MTGLTCSFFHGTDLFVSKTVGGFFRAIEVDDYCFGLTEDEARELARRIRLTIRGELDGCWAPVAGFSIMAGDGTITLGFESEWDIGLLESDAGALADELDPDGAQEVGE